MSGKPKAIILVLVLLLVMAGLFSLNLYRLGNENSGSTDKAIGIDDADFYAMKIKESIDSLYKVGIISQTELKAYSNSPLSARWDAISSRCDLPPELPANCRPDYKGYEPCQIAGMNGRPEPKINYCKVTDEESSKIEQTLTADLNNFKRQQYICELRTTLETVQGVVEKCREYRHAKIKEPGQ